jgi:hypothetical protein
VCCEDGGQSAGAAVVASLMSCRLNILLLRCVCHRPPTPPGTPAQLDAEARRLSSRLAALAAADAVAAAAAATTAGHTTPASTAAAGLLRCSSAAASMTPATLTAADRDLDPQGQLLSSLLQWRQQRQAALSAEVARLCRQQGRLERAAAAAASGSSHLTAWLKQNGAQVWLAWACLGWWWCNRPDQLSSEALSGR